MTYLWHREASRPVQSPKRKRVGICAEARHSPKYPRARAWGSELSGVGWAQPTTCYANVPARRGNGGLSPPYIFALILMMFWLMAKPVIACAADGPQPSRLEKLNAAFMKHLDARPASDALAVATIRDGWKTTYEKSPEGFVPDALALLNANYREALAAFDDGRSADVVRLLEPLRSHADVFLAANAAYFHTRAQIDLNKFEEVEADLARTLADPAAFDALTPYAPHLAFLRGFLQARNLHFKEATETLAMAHHRYPDAPEAIANGIRQLLLELERRETGGLDEVATVMQYVADRLKTADASQRVRSRQEEVLALLDKLIKDEEDKEQQQKGGGGSASKKKPSGKKDAKNDKPMKPRDDSETPTGAGEIGDLHAAPKVDPGEAWGKLPPTEREKILQSLRDRFPSRYRQLVEQYYRSLAEQK